MLSPREKQVVELVLQGKSNKQIAFSLGVSERTIEFHLKNIYIKMNVASRVELILKLGKPAGDVSANLVESTVDFRHRQTDNSNQPNQINLAQSLQKIKIVIQKEIAMNIKLMWEESGKFLRSHPLVFGMLLFLIGVINTRFVITELGLYYWFSYVLLAVVLAFSGIVFGFGWKKIVKGELRYHPIIYLGIIAVLPLTIAGLDEIFLYTIVKSVGASSFEILDISVKAAWDLSQVGSEELTTQRSITSEIFWVLSIAYTVLFFGIGLLTSRKNNNQNLAVS
jgi:DNA-binding CsgD family transcriptional regulator